MNKKCLIKRTGAVIFYLGGIFFGVFFGLIMLNRNHKFDVFGLIMSCLFVLVPISIATILLISSIKVVDNRYKVVKVLVLFVFVFYILLLISILFRNSMRQSSYAISEVSIDEYFKRHSNIIPFKTIIQYIWFFINDTINKSTIIENLLGNLLLFAPMGILLPCIFNKLRKLGRFIMILLIFLLSVEIVQLITFSGSFDIDDVILNIFGAFVFFGIWKLNITQRILKKIYVLK